MLFRAGLSGVLLLLLPLAAQAERRHETITLELEEGSTITAELRIPAEGDGPYPAVMLFGGLRSAAEVLDLLPETEHHVALASFDYPYEPRDFDFPGMLRHLPAARRAVFDTLEGIGELHAALAAHPEIDAERITVVGASLGAPFAVISAADHGIPGMVAVQGYGKLATVISHQFRFRWEPKWGRAGALAAQLLGNAIALWARLPEPEAHARRLTRSQHALLITAEDDRIIPETASEALWKAMQSSQAKVSRETLPGGHLHPEADALILRIYREAVAWKRLAGLL